MVRKVRLTESELIKLIKKVISESNYSEYNVSSQEVLNILRENGFNIYKLEGMEGNLIGVKNIDLLSNRIGNHLLIPYS